MLYTGPSTKWTFNKTIYVSAREKKPTTERDCKAMPLHVTTHFWIQLHDIRDGSKNTEGIQLVLYTLWQLLSPSLLTQTFLAPLYPTLYVNLPMTELEEGSYCDLSQLLLLPQDLLPSFNEREPIYPPSLILFALPSLCFFWLLLPSLERLDS